METLDEEIHELDARIEALIAPAWPELLGLVDAEPDNAAALVGTSGDNPERLHSEAARARLCGVSALQSSSGK